MNTTPSSSLAKKAVRKLKLDMSIANPGNA
jgi:hypothetical protein